jgi:hypothetical protein
MYCSKMSFPRSLNSAKKKIGVFSVDQRWQSVLEISFEVVPVNCIWLFRFYIWYSFRVPGKFVWGYGCSFFFYLVQS